METRYCVSYRPCNLQDRIDQTERGQVQLIPVCRLLPSLIWNAVLTVLDFSDSVEARGNFVGNNRSPGNENRRWHGTRRKCTLGDKGCTTFCSDAQCYLCCIIKTSFDVAKSGKGQFGTGIYTSSTSSKFVSRFLVH